MASPMRTQAYDHPNRPSQRRSPPVLAIATPVYGGVHPCFTQALMHTKALLPRHGIDVQWGFLTGNSLISRGRNNLTAYCLSNADVTHILWIDGDIAWQPQDVLRLLSHDVDLV